MEELIQKLKGQIIEQLNIEDIKDLRRGKRTNRSMGHWTYTDIFAKLSAYCEEQGVLVQKVRAGYTSQRCSACGWVQKANRKGELFMCQACGHAADADINAAINIGAGLPQLEDQQLLNNRTGFYWNGRTGAVCSPC